MPTASAGRSSPPRWSTRWSTPRAPRSCSGWARRPGAGTGPHPGVAGRPRGVRHVGVLASGRRSWRAGRTSGARIARRPRGPQADRTGHPMAADEPPPPVRHRETAGFFADGVADGPLRPCPRCSPAVTGWVRGAPGFLPGPRRARSTWPSGVAAMVPALLRVRHRAGRRLRRGGGIEETAEVYFDLADRLQITRLRDRITALPREDRWSTMARAALRDDLYAAHASLDGGRARSQRARRVEYPGGTAGRLGLAQRVRGHDGRPDPGRDLGERALHVHHPVGSPPRRLRTLVAASSLPEAQ